MNKQTQLRPRVSKGLGLTKKSLFGAVDASKIPVQAPARCDLVSHATPLSRILTHKTSFSTKSRLLVRLLLASLLLGFGPFASTVGFAQSAANGSGPAVTSTSRLLRFGADSAHGFNFPYLIYIPAGTPLRDALFLLVEPNNTGFVNDALAVHSSAFCKLFFTKRLTFGHRRIICCSNRIFSTRSFPSSARCK